MGIHQYKIGQIGGVASLLLILVLIWPVEQRRATAQIEQIVVIEGIRHDKASLFQKLLEAPKERLPAVCWHPESNQKNIDAFYESRKSMPGNSLSSNTYKYQLNNRWSSTATDGTGLNLGDATTLTWSIVPDGTAISGGCGVAGESNDPSNLIAFMDSIYGAGPGGADLSLRPWFVYFEDVYQQWSPVTGLTYVYEDNDDGAIYASEVNIGILNVRGDLRIGGHRLDGNSNVLACNYFPDNGDMIIDTDDNFYSSGNILGFKNMLSHEHGHGLGFSHSCPTNFTKLMEPFISLVFDGPQEDDILAGNRLYGDRNENNSTTGSAHSLGAMVSGDTTVLSQLSIDDASESDYFTFSISSAEDIVAIARPTGTTYLSGPQLGNGNCDPGEDFNALAQSNIGLELIASDGTTVIDQANEFAIGHGETICLMDQGAGTYYLRVFGNASAVQMYEIEVAIGALACPECHPLINEVDYDQDGADQAEFIELYNPCPSSIDLSTYHLELINGSNTTVYETINLSGMLATGDYYVVCMDSVNTANCDLVINLGFDVLQNGAPDAIALYDTSGLVDALSYDGTVGGLNEGSGVGLVDDSAVVSSGLSRVPNGTDTDMNNVDFRQVCITPGTVNGSVTQYCEYDRSCLTTFFAADRRADGNMFDITNSGTTKITISSLEVNLLSGTHTVEVYYTTSASSYSGETINPGAWTLLGTTTVVSSGPDLRTTVNISGLTVLPLQSKGIYVTATNGDFPLLYTEGTSSYNDGILQIDLNPGIANEYPFGETYSPRQWNGTLCYVGGGATTVAINTFQADLNEGNVDTTSYTFNITRGGDLSHATSVTYNTSGGASDPVDIEDFGGSFPGGTVTFQPLEDTVQLSIQVTGDSIPEHDEQFVVTLSNPTDGATLSGSTAQGIIRNDDGSCNLQICKDTTIYLDNAGNFSIDSTYVIDPSVQNCSLSSMQLTQTTFTCNDIGFQFISVLVTSINGDTASCAATIIVLDTISPMASCSDITVYLDASGNATIDSSFVDNGSSDNCAVEKIALSVSDFGCVDIGDNSVTVVVSDAAGNTNACNATVTVVDTISPVAICQNTTIYLDANGNATIDSSFVDNGSSDNCAVETIALSDSDFGCVDIGDNSVTVVVSDAAGNTNACNATVTVVDTISPVAICQNTTIYLDASGNATIDSSFVDNGSSDNCAVEKIALLVSDFGCVDIGDNSVTVVVSDAAGNTNACIATVTVVDTISPVAVCMNTTVYLDASGNATIDSSFVDNGSSDNCAVEKIALSVSDFSCADIGDNSVTVVVSDAAGNTNACNATVTVVDTISPVAVCMNTTVYLDASGNATIDSSFVHNGSSDNCAVEKIALSVSDFSCADIGDNSVTVVVSDAAGNTNACNATVTVVDTISPVAICQNITVYLDASGNVTIDSSIVDDGSSDNCAVETIALFVSDFSCTDVGDKTVNVVVSDASGNTTACAVIVTVVDTIAPKVTCFDTVLILDPIGNGTLSPAIINDNSSDNCGVDSLYLNITSFDCGDIGIQNVILFARDQSSNIGHCMASVSVQLIDTLLVEDNILVAFGESGVYIAANVIVSNATIKSGNSVVFKAKNGVVLLDDFKVESGAVFDILIEDCE